jgi:hypothetical protein
MLSTGVIHASAGLVVLYGLVIVVWYELFRSQVLDRLRRRRGDGAGEGAPVQLEPLEDDARAGGHGRVDENGRAAENGLAGENGRAGENGHAPVDPAGSDGDELDRTRRYFYRSRQAAQRERDAAIEAANEAAQEAIGRIERRYREIDRDLLDEETERISEMLARAPSENGDARARRVL